jgi:hypothetical protein
MTFIAIVAFEAVVTALGFWGYRESRGDVMFAGLSALGTP